MKTSFQEFKDNKQKIKDAENALRLAELDLQFQLSRFCSRFLDHEHAIREAKMNGYEFADAVVMHLLSECETDEEKDAVLAHDITPV